MKDKFGFYLDVYRKIKKTKCSFYEMPSHRDLICLKAFRKANYYSKKNKKFFSFFWRLKLKSLRNKYDFNLYAETQIGEGLFIGHNGPIIINEKAIIGKNCNIATGVTIGQENRGKRKGTPIIGNKVWIGTNAVIVGNVNVGNNVLIAPNAFVNFDVPSNSIVIGNPAKIIHSDNATENYINNLVEEIL